jgi:predicted DNA-binding transcriptional regulator AlpA
MTRPPQFAAGGGRRSTRADGDAQLFRLLDRANAVSWLRACSRPWHPLVLRLARRGACGDDPAWALRSTARSATLGPLTASGNVRAHVYAFQPARLLAPDKGTSRSRAMSNINTPSDITAATNQVNLVVVSAAQQSVRNAIQRLPLMLCDNECAWILGISRATFWRRVKCGCVKPQKKNGATSRWQKEYILGLMDTGIRCTCSAKKS